MKIIDKDKIKYESRTLFGDRFSKEDLERYYIEEKKSMTEISEIYECSLPTIKNKLEKYEISIRPRGSFLISDDGETLYSKYKNGEISASEYQNRWAKNKGYEDSGEYNNKLVKNKGYKGINDYVNTINHKRGKCLPVSENKNCPSYLGVYICENKEFISKIINIVESMPNNNPGYDIICSKYKKIDVKCACLANYNTWNFHIRYNKIADYFLCIAFDNRESLNVEHIWLVKGDTFIKKTNAYLSKEFIVNEKDVIHIGKGNRALKRWIKHEITDTYKLEEAQKLCDNFKKITKGD